MAKKLEITFSVFRGDDDHEVELSVTANAHPPEPDIGIFSPQLEDICWEDSAGNEINLLDKEKDALEERLLQVYYGN